MSADLFAAFDTSFEAPKQPQQNAENDPFSLLQQKTGPARPQLGHQDTQWPTFQPNQAPSPPIPSPSWLTPKHPPLPVVSPQVADEEDDGWGDFESADTGFHTPSINQPSPNAAAPSVQPQQRPTRVVRASTIELMTNSLLDLGPEMSRLDPVIERPSWESSVRQSTESRPKNPDPNVLFDADDFDGQPPSEEDEDDFGDFEGPASGPVLAPVPAQPAVDLLSSSYTPHSRQTRKASPSQLLSTLSLDDGPSIYPQAPKSPSFHERNPFPGLGLKTPIAEGFPGHDKPKTDSPVTAWPSFDSQAVTKKEKEKNSLEDGWGTFEDLPPTPVVPVQPSKTTTTSKTTMSTTASIAEPASDWDWGSWDASKDTPQAPRAEPSSVDTITSGPPPTNIPPPAVLLSIFPSLLSAASISLFQPTASVSAAVKDRILTSPETIHFLRGYLALATVAARIIAGRRLRWHRDKFLSQSMTISAATGGKGGMKLTGIDKSQSAREDAEAADVVAAWRDVVGRLRSAVSVANVAIARGNGVSLKVPELAESIKASTVKGAVTAPKPCVVCGLKRDERLAKVDFEVEDSFGEWWVEFWGHRECRNFWVEHEAALRSR